MFHADIKKLTKDNTFFRRVIYTGDNAQLVLMSIPREGEIGEEVHKSVDQILFLVEGEGEAIIGGESFPFEEHDVVFVPAGTIHNFKNTGSGDLKLYTVYSPPNHPENTIHPTREDALKDKKDENFEKVMPDDYLENM